jgi:hypothetical protein
MSDLSDAEAQGDEGGNAAGDGSNGEGEGGVRRRGSVRFRLGAPRWKSLSATSAASSLQRSRSQSQGAAALAAAAAAAAEVAAEVAADGDGSNDLAAPLLLPRGGA